MALHAVSQTSLQTVLHTLLHMLLPMIMHTLLHTIWRNLPHFKRYYLMWCMRYYVRCCIRDYLLLTILHISLHTPSNRYATPFEFLLSPITKYK